MAWIEGLHPEEIELGLDRLRPVYQALKPDISCPVVTVSGTNGKGSVVASLEAIYGAAAYRTAAYTSPHLVDYRERLRIGGKMLTEADWCAAFMAVDTARGSIPLTYFEFGTLAALWLARQAAVDVLILEVGLGGRLDAVNIVDADVAVITNVALDHLDWLGPDRDSIGREKAGIARAGRPLVIGEAEVPDSVLSTARSLGAGLYRAGHEFRAQRDTSGWSFHSDASVRAGLPQPLLQGPHQLENAATALMVITLLQHRLPVQQQDVRQGLLSARLPGRFQIEPAADGLPEVVLDVAHNPAAAGILAAALTTRPAAGRTLAVVGMLRDKNQAETLKPLLPLVDQWHVCTLAGSRGGSAAALASVLKGLAGGKPVFEYDAPEAAWQQVKDLARSDDRVLVFGSFQTVGVILGAHSEWLH